MVSHWWRIYIYIKYVFFVKSLLKNSLDGGSLKSIFESTRSKKYIYSAPEYTVNLTTTVFWVKV